MPNNRYTNSSLNQTPVTGPFGVPLLNSDGSDNEIRVARKAGRYTLAIKSDNAWRYFDESLKAATASELGTIKVGSGLAVTQDGVLSATGGGGGSGDITGVTLTSDSGTASDTTANVDLTIAGGNAIGTTATGTTVTINHTDTSSQASVDNSGYAYIQDITLDTYGHITGITSSTWALADEAVTLAKMQHVATDVFLGRTSSGTGDVEAMSVSDVTTLLSLDNYITSLNVAGLTDTTITSIASGHFLRYSGSAYVNTALVAGDIPSLATSKITSGTFADARIAASNVTQHQASITGTGALNSGSITSGFGAIDNGSSAITTTGTVTTHILTLDSSSGCRIYAAANSSSTTPSVGVAGQAIVSAAAGTPYWGNPIAGSSGSEGHVQLSSSAGAITSSSNFAFGALDASPLVLTYAGNMNITGAFEVKNGSTSAGYINFYEDSSNGTNKVTLIGPASTADITLTLPSAAGTIIGTGNSTSITSVGTITAGVWNSSTVIASAYLDADTAHLSGTQTFSGAKTFSSNLTLSANLVITGYKITANTSAGAGAGVGTAGNALLSYGAGGGVYWGTPTSGPAGSTEHVQYNASGAMAGEANFKWEYAENNLAIDGTIGVTGAVTWSGGGSANANTAYGWGNHASGGYGTSNLALGSTSSTAHRGDHGVTAYNHSQAAHAPSDANNYTLPSTVIHESELSSSTSSTSTTVAANSAAVKSAYDRAWMPVDFVQTAGTSHASCGANTTYLTPSSTASSLTSVGTLTSLTLSGDATLSAQLKLAGGSASRLYFNDRLGLEGATNGSAVFVGEGFTTTYIKSTNMGIGVESPSSYNNYANNLVVYEAGHSGITIATNSTNHTSLYFADGTSGADAYRGYLDYDHADNSLDIATNGTQAIRIDSSQNSSFAGDIKFTGTTAFNIGSRSSGASAWLGFGGSLNNLKIGASDFTSEVAEFNMSAGTSCLTITKTGLSGYTAPIIDGSALSASGDAYIRAEVGAFGDAELGFVGKNNNATWITGYMLHGSSNWQLYNAVGGGGAVLTVNTSGNATFAGEITVAGGNDYSATFQKDVKIMHAGGAPRIIIGNTTNANDYAEIAYNSSANTMRIGVQGDESTIVLDTSSNATFGGNVYATTDVVAYYSSDPTLKENKELISNPLDKIDSIGGYSFDWKESANEYGKHLKGKDYGVMADEIAHVLPELVQTRENGIRAVKYDKLVPLLIEGIKELKQQLDTLKGIA